MAQLNDDRATEEIFTSYVRWLSRRNRHDAVKATRIALLAHVEEECSDETGSWGTVCLENARLPGLSGEEFQSHLKALTRQRLLPKDGSGWFWSSELLRIGFSATQIGRVDHVGGHGEYQGNKPPSCSEGRWASPTGSLMLLFLCPRHRPGLLLQQFGSPGLGVTRSSLHNRNTSFISLIFTYDVCRLHAGSRPFTETHEEERMMRFIGQILRGIATALASSIRLPFDVLTDIGRMLGLAPAAPVLPPPAAFEQSVDVEAAELRHKLDAAPANVTVPELTGHTPGQLIHAYASASGRSRESFDMSLIPEHASIALLTLQPPQLYRLALAGPAACERWASGHKGIVGVPLPSRYSTTDQTARDDVAKTDCNAFLAAVPQVA